MANKLEATLERWVFASRWLLAPFFIGLVLAIAVLLVKFVQTLLGARARHVLAERQRDDHPDPVVG